MNKFMKVRALEVNTMVLLAAVGLLGGCGTTLQMANRNLEEDRLVPGQVAENIDFLNEYTHHLALPQNASMAIDIALERTNMLVSGDQAYLQVGLATQTPTFKDYAFHLVVSAQNIDAANIQARIASVVTAAKAFQENDRNRLKVSLDVASAYQGTKQSLGSVLSADVMAQNLENVMRDLSRHRFDDKSHHIVMVMGEHNDYTLAQKQNILDMVAILAAKSISVSALAIAEKPDFGFLKALVERGLGQLTIVNQQFDYHDWFKGELENINASELTDIQVAISFSNGLKVEQIFAPLIYPVNNNKVEYNVAHLKQGQDHIFFAKLNVLAMQESFLSNFIHVDVRYFDQDQQRYFAIHQEANVNYVEDPNDTLQSVNTQVERSKLILNTQKTLQDITPLIESQRYYKAVALLTAQSRDLKRLGKTDNDKELLYDASVLDKYIDQLYNFDNKTFQTLQKMRDLSWDKHRFVDTYL